MPDIKNGEIKISGLADLEKRLKDLPDKLARNVMSGAVRAGAVVIQKEAQRLAPVGTKEHWLGKTGSKSRVLLQPGTLRKNIKVRRAPSKSAGKFGGLTYWVYVSRRIWYWKFVELGTSREAARPYLRPAFDTMKEKAVEAIRDYAAKRIEKEVAKSGR